jgi:hypothetical protein
MDDVIDAFVAQGDSRDHFSFLAWTVPFHPSVSAPIGKHFGAENSTVKARCHALTFFSNNLLPLVHPP